MQNKVFISYKNSVNGILTEDAAMAAELYAALSAAGIPTFYATETLLERGTDRFKEIIDKELDQCLIMIVVGTSLQNITSSWVKYEWDGFCLDILNGQKNGKVFTYVDGINPHDLPRALRSVQSFDKSKDHVSVIVRFIKNALLDLGEGVSESAVLVNSEAPTKLDDKLRSFIRDGLCPESMIVPLKRALLGDRETRREVQIDIEEARPKVRGQFLACMEKLIDFPNEVVRGEAYFCLGSYSDDRVRINEAFFVRGLQDESDFVKACCANVLQYYVPLGAETEDALEEIVERIHLIGLENAGKYTRKLHYYAKRTLKHNGGSRR